MDTRSQSVEGLASPARHLGVDFLVSMSPVPIAAQAHRKCSSVPIAFPVWCADRDERSTGRKSTAADDLA
jgi:hypothetical protein